MERPKRAFIRLEWYNAIVEYMTPVQRCEFYEACLTFCYFGERPSFKDAVVKAAYSMVERELQFDCKSYERVVARNRANANSNRAYSEEPTQTEPKNPKEPQKEHNIQYTVTSNKKSSKEDFLSFDPGERDIVFRRVFLELWRRGCFNSEEESNRLIDYYDARGWVDKGGNKIVAVAPLCRVWKLDPNACSSYYARVRKSFYEFFCDLPRDVLAGVDITLLRQFSRLQRVKEGPNMILAVYVTGTDFVNLMEEQLIKPFTMWVKSQGYKGVEYRQITPEQERRAEAEGEGIDQ